MFAKFWNVVKPLLLDALRVAAVAFFAGLARALSA
jgi:hypothetical protein